METIPIIGFFEIMFHIRIIRSLAEIMMNAGKTRLFQILELLKNDLHNKNTEVSSFLDVFNDFKVHLGISIG